MGTWDKEDREARLKRLWADGLSASEIAGQLGVSRDAVLAKADRLRRKGGPDAPARRDGDGPGASKGRRCSPPRPVKPPADDGPPRLPVVSRWVEPAVVLPPTAVTVRDLEDHHCRWPLGDPQDTAFRLCGGRRSLGLPYCAAHAARAYVASTPAPGTVLAPPRPAGAPVGGESTVGVGVGAQETLTASGEAPGRELILEGADD